MVRWSHFHGSRAHGLSLVAWYLALRDEGRATGPECESPLEKVVVGGSGLVGLHLKNTLAFVY